MRVVWFWWTKVEIDFDIVGANIFVVGFWILYTLLMITFLKKNGHDAGLLTQQPLTPASKPQGYPFFRKSTLLSCPCIWKKWNNIQSSCDIFVEICHENGNERAEHKKSKNPTITKNIANAISWSFSTSSLPKYPYSHWGAFWSKRRGGRGILANDPL